jgi:very-short-patch-repair endonuclease
MITCKICNLEFKSLDSLRRHLALKHKISSEETYVEYVLGGIQPPCKCGCGTKTNFLSFEKGFVGHVLGHASRINNNWGHNKEAISKSHETQKKMYNTGELVIWNKGLTIDDSRVKDNIIKVMSNPERGKNISKKLTGVNKSKKHKENLSKSQIISWCNDEKRLKQRYNRANYYKNKKFNKKSKLEQNFEELLITLGIVYETQYPIKGYLFDFFIKSKNVLLEVDGDWYHFNPKIHKLPLTPIQIHNINNDSIKNDIAKEDGYILIRFWEDDINNNLDNVINTLKLLL